MGSAYIDLDFNKKSKKIILPVDWQKDDGQKLDIGPKTIKKYQKIIKTAKTIIWSGPIGKVEDKRFIKGSIAIARAIIDSNAFSVAGGGDTAQLLDKLKLKNKFSFFSTGGGAMLKFLAGKKLPALEALEKSK